MSADSMSFCPKCHPKKLNEIEQLKQQVRNGKGDLSSIEYTRLLIKLQEMTDSIKEDEGETLGEYHEVIWVNDKLQFSYYAKCDNPECGFEVYIKDKVLWEDEGENYVG